VIHWPITRGYRIKRGYTAECLYVVIHGRLAAGASSGDVAGCITTAVAPTARNAQFSFLIRADVGAIGQLSAQAESEAAEAAAAAAVAVAAWCEALMPHGRAGLIIGCQPTVNHSPSAAYGAAAPCSCGDRITGTCCLPAH